MPYDSKKELQRVINYYTQDPLQKRYSALVTGETNSGKSFLLRTARFPVHIDSFDPGGSKCLEPWIKKGDIVVDTSWEKDDPFEPKAFAEWMKATERRLQLNYFDQFGTYCLDSLTTFSDAVMNYGMAAAGRAGETPLRNKDYNPQKVKIVNYIRKLMNLKCDFILTAHLERLEELLSIDSSSGIKRYETKYRLLVTGKAVITIPLLFDELYVLLGDDSRDSGNPKRKLLLDSLGTYIARSRLKSDGKLDGVEEPHIKNLLKKAGLKWEDKPALEIEKIDK